MKNIMHIKLLIGFLLLLGKDAIAAPIPSKSPAKILLEGGRLHVGNGQVIENSYIGIENGKITLVKNALAFTLDKSKYDTVVNIAGQEVYPGFFAPNATLGLTEIDAVRATRDFNEVGELNPHIRALIAFNVESNVVATVRTNGVLFAQATPRGGVISGTSSVFRLDGWNWEDAVVKADDGIHLNWPAFMKRTWRETKQNENYKKEINAIRQFFQASKAWADAPEKGKLLDLRYAAMKGLFGGEKRLFIHADHIQELLDVIDFIKEFGISFPVLVGGYDSHLITPQLRDNKVAVMLPRVHSLPAREGDDLHHPFKLPYLLQQAGVLFCLQNEGDMEAMNTRNIPFLAGTARSYGLTTEQAVAAVSLNAAKILGVDKRYGSVEEGKMATLFVSKGDALDMAGNQLTMALVDGRFIDLRNRQTELYEKYKARYAD
jgi:imidazolonepropionase-like amidohydrolase